MVKLLYIIQQGTVNATPKEGEMGMVEMEDKDRQEAVARIWDLLCKGVAVTLLLFVLSLRYAGWS